jgi:hypothetical protein
MQLLKTLPLPFQSKRKQPEAKISTENTSFSPSSHSQSDTFQRATAANTRSGAEFRFDLDVLSLLLAMRTKSSVFEQGLIVSELSTITQHVNGLRANFLYQLSQYPYQTNAADATYAQFLKKRFSPEARLVRWGEDVKTTTTLLALALPEEQYQPFKDQLLLRWKAQQSNQLNQYALSRQLNTEDAATEKIRQARNLIYRFVGFKEQMEEQLKHFRNGMFSSSSTDKLILDCRLNLPKKQLIFGVHLASNLPDLALIPLLAAEQSRVLSLVTNNQAVDSQVRNRVKQASIDGLIEGKFLGLLPPVVFKKTRTDMLSASQIPLRSIEEAFTYKAPLLLAPPSSSSEHSSVGY